MEDRRDTERGGPVVTRIDPFRPDGPALGRAASALLDGRLVAFPTETVYGLGAAITRPGALRRIFEVKGRPATDPLIVHVAELAAVEGVAAVVPAPGRELAEAFWPGPLTMVLPRGPLVDDVVTAGGPSVGVRVPAHPVAEGLLRAADTGIAAPSANRFGRISPTEASDVVDDLGSHLDGSDEVLDAGPTPLGIESTVVDLTAERPVVLRHGGVTVEDLRAVIGQVDAPERRVVGDDEATAAPGALLRHYAPRRPLALVEGDDSLVHDLRAALVERGIRVVVVDLPEPPEAAAAALYRGLRAADGPGADLLLAVARTPAGLGRAVNDRLYRAAHGRVVLDSGLRTVDRLVASARG